MGADAGHGALIGPQEATVVAAKAGTIVDDGSITGQIIIQHDGGYYTVYGDPNAHDIFPNLAIGDYVDAGTPLTTISNIIYPGGDHLHFQVRYDPNGNGLGTGLSTIDITELANVTVGGKLMTAYELDIDPRTLNPLRTQIGGPSLPFMPLSDSGGAFQFVYIAGALGVGVDTPMYVDPAVAIGYDFEIQSGPLFASVILPSIGDDLFDLYLWDLLSGDWLFETILSANILYSFDAGGVDRFRILGIESSANLDPTDTSAFVTGLTFASAGEVRFTQTPISVNVPEPGTLVLFGSGLLGLVALRRRRKTLAKA